MDSGEQPSTEIIERPVAPWVEITWHIVLGLAVWMAFGTMPRLIEWPFVAALWTLMLVPAVAFTTMPFMLRRHEFPILPVAYPKRAYRFPPEIFWWAMPWMIMGLIAISNRYWLASVYFIGWVELGLLRIHQAKYHSQWDHIARSPILSRVYALGFWCAPRISHIARSVARPIGAAWTRHFERRDAVALRKAFGNPDCLIYLLYSERHQRAYFMDEGGILFPFRHLVAARHWEGQKEKMRALENWREFCATPEGALFKRFGLSNKREHLPFIVVADSQNRLTPLFFNTAYRARRRDQGFALSPLV